MDIVTSQRVPEIRGTSRGLDLRTRLLRGRGQWSIRTLLKLIPVETNIKNGPEGTLNIAYLGVVLDGQGEVVISINAFHFEA
jgi:hypothetical protein